MEDFYRYYVRVFYRYYDPESRAIIDHNQQLPMPAGRSGYLIIEGDDVRSAAPPTCLCAPALSPPFTPLRGPVRVRRFLLSLQEGDEYLR